MFECPNTKYAINDRCYDHRSTNYTPNDCQSVDGYYVHGYCYINRCSYFAANGHCYRYKTASYSNRTCRTIGGYYAAETTGHYHCYYTSFECPQHSINGQCYSRASNESQTVCRAIPGSYFDDSNNTCYYHCTEMPKLQGRYLRFRRNRYCSASDSAYFCTFLRSVVCLSVCLSSFTFVHAA